MFGSDRFNSSLADLIGESSDTSHWIRRLNRRMTAFSILTVCSFGLTAPAHAADLKFTGYAKTYGVYRAAPDVENLPPELDDELFQSQNALRLMWGGDIADDASLEFHYEIKPIYSSQEFGAGFTGLDATTTTGASQYRLADINISMESDNGERVLLQNLDRFNLRFDLGKADITIGRQAISFGSARFVSPTDIFEPFMISTLDKEYRVGVDAVRYQASLGAFSEVDLGLVIGHEGRADASAIYGRYKTSISGNDLEGTVILRDQFTLVGGGIERAIFDFGFWSEVAFVTSKNESDYFRGSIGIDHSIGETGLFMIEYHHSTAGAKSPGEYLDLYQTEPLENGGVYLLGRNYIIPSVSLTATPLLGLSASVFINIDDESTFFRAGGEYNLSDNLYTDFGVFVGIGDNSRMVPALPPIDVGSEFGDFPFMAYASLRYYF